MNTISTIWGIIVLLFALVAFLPFLGWANWFIIIFAIVGVIIGALGKAKTGMVLNAIGLFFCLFRLILGGGII